MKARKVALLLTAIAVCETSLQLTGCASTASKELADMVSSGEKIDIQLVASENYQLLVGTPVDWKRLGELIDQEELRDVMDEQLDIHPFGSHSKFGVLYVNPETEEWESNNTIENVYKNKAFHEYWEDADKQKEIQEATLSAYIDLDESTPVDEVKIAALNAYFNIFADGDDGSFSGENILTREQFITGLAKAHVQAEDGAVASEEMVDLLGDVPGAAYASYVIESSYLDKESESLNDLNFTKGMTRAEALYMIVKTYYPDEFASVDVSSKCYSDCKNAGDIAAKASEQTETTVSGAKYYRAANLAYMLENPSKGMDEELYRAMVVAYNHELAGDSTSESRWDEGITKLEALQMLIKVYEDAGTTINCKQGSYNGKEVQVGDKPIEEYTVDDFETPIAYQYFLEFGEKPPVSFAEAYEIAEQKLAEVGCDVDLDTYEDEYGSNFYDYYTSSISGAEHKNDSKHAEAITRETFCEYLQYNINSIVDFRNEQIQLAKEEERQQAASSNHSSNASSSSQASSSSAGYDIPQSNDQSQVVNNDISNSGEVQSGFSFDGTDNYESGVNYIQTDTDPNAQPSYAFGLNGN